MNDFIVIGGGIAGIASAELIQRSGRSVLLLEAEPFLGSASSSELHGWFHTGALYAALPDNSFFKTLVGNIDDLLAYYSDFPQMNLEVRNHLRTKNLDGWFSNSLNLYSYISPFDKEVGWGMKLPWLAAIYNARRHLEGFDKLVTSQDLSSQVLKYKNPKTKSTVYEDELDLNLGKISKTFITRDRTMNAYAIMKSLVASFLAHGGRIKTDSKVVKTGQNWVQTDNETYYGKIIINATGANNPKATNTHLSPLVVVYPALSELNFIKMTPNVSNTFNHLVHKCEDFQYSVIGNGIYIEDTPEERSTVASEVLSRIEDVFGVDLDDYKVNVYFGKKTEVTTKSQLRNYQYHIIKDNNHVSIFPGKFTLGFSLAVNLCRRLGIDPVGHFSAEITSEHHKTAKLIVKRSKHYDIAQALHVN